MTKQQSKQITLFTFVNEGNGYIKRPITLFDLITQLSDKSAESPDDPKDNHHLSK